MRIDHRGPRGRLIERLSDPVLGLLGIDSRQYWLLVDLLNTLSRRQEIAHLGGRENSMRLTVILLFLAFGSLSIMMVSFDIRTDYYLAVFTALTAFQLCVVLLPEIAANLVNPSEITVLAHQPITGFTWTFAKITHLFRVIVYLVVAINGAPAFSGLLLPHGNNRQMVGYPFLHLMLTLGVGLIVGLGCCSIFGWLIRFTPPKRLQAIAAVIQLVPILLMFGFMTWGRWFVDLAPMRSSDLVTGPWLIFETIPGMSSSVVVAISALLSLWALVFGLRALSSNQLVLSYGQAVKAPRKSSRLTLNLRSLISARIGNQVRRAGFVYMSIVIMRDWQFWRNFFAMSLGVFCALGYVMVSGWDGSPFTSGFNTIHLFPHLLGLATLMSCRFLAFGSDHKSAWLFTTIPRQFVGSFAQGSTIFLFLFVAILPHFIGFLALLWFWPFIDLALFIAFSSLVSLLYLLLGLGYIEGIPFGRHYDPEKTILSFFFLVIWGLIMVTTIGIQLLLFLSHYAVMFAVCVLSVIAINLAKSSVSRFAVDIKVHLDELSVQ